MALCVDSENGTTNDSCAVSVEAIKHFSGDGTSDTGGDGFAGVANEIGDGEQFLGFIKFFGGNVERPVVGQFKRQTSMVRSFYNDDISHEVWSQKELKGLDDVGSL